MIEIRKQENGTATITGVASLFDTWYRVGPFTERVMPGAFTDTLRSQPDVLLTAEHDKSRAVARTPTTLSLTQDATGLRYTGTVDLADADARSLVSKIERGVYRESSFAFRVPAGGDAWNEPRTERTIHAVDLHRGEVSVVPFGASPTTGATVARALVGTIEQRRAVAEAVTRSGWCGPAVRVELRQSRPTSRAGAPCPDCAGSGDCSACDGTGRVNDDDADDWQATPSPMRSAVLAPNDTGELLRHLQAAGGRRREDDLEREFLRECRQRRERAWASHPDLLDRDRRFAEYARMVG